MVAELKYFPGGKAVAAARTKVLQDVARLLSAKMAQTAPRLLVVCQLPRGKNSLWSARKDRGGKAQKVAQLLLPRKFGEQTSAKCSAILKLMPKWQKRTPKCAHLKAGRVVRSTLVAEAEFQHGRHTGVVRVWNVE